LDPLITLTTDFGLSAPYVAAVKGVLLSVCPSARILDLTHQIRPFDVRHAAFFLAEALPYFPAATLHVVVVDPGVGGERALLYVESPRIRLLAPDNGCWTQLQFPAPPSVRRLANSSFWRNPVSDTFHGRDILAPVAGRLALGLDPAELGPEVETWVTLAAEPPRFDPPSGELVGAVAFVDDFGNVITNIAAASLRLEEPAVVRVGEREVQRWVRTYAEAEPGALVALCSSSGRLELAVVQGRADERLAAVPGTPVRVCRARFGGTGVSPVLLPKTGETPVPPAHGRAPPVRE
jgi:S-adenosylmethionine hydrolase